MRARPPLVRFCACCLWLAIALPSAVGVAVAQDEVEFDDVVDVVDMQPASRADWSPRNLFLPLTSLFRGTGYWYIVAEKLQSAYTMAATTAQTAVTFVDKTDPNAAIRLAASDKLGITHHVDLQGMAVAEWADY